MQVEEITQILRESPSVRLIKSRSVDFFLAEFNLQMQQNSD